MSLISGKFSVFSLSHKHALPLFCLSEENKTKKKRRSRKKFLLCNLPPSSPPFFPAPHSPGGSRSCRWFVQRQPRPEPLPRCCRSRQSRPSEDLPQQGCALLVSFVLPPWPRESTCLVPLAAARKFEEIHTTLQRGIKAASLGWNAEQSRIQSLARAPVRLREKHLLILYALLQANEGRYCAIWKDWIYRRVFSAPHHHPHHPRAYFLGNWLLLLHFTSPGR